MNQIDSYTASLPRLADPHELASWVNQIDGYSGHSPRLPDPHELASWVNQIDGYTTLTLRDFRTPTAGSTRAVARPGLPQIPDWQISSIRLVR